MSKRGPPLRSFTEKQKYESARLLAIGVTKKRIEQDLNLTHMTIDRCASENAAVPSFNRDNITKEQLLLLIDYMRERNQLPYDALAFLSNCAPDQ